MFCPRCGWRLADEARACDDCGADIVAIRGRRRGLLGAPLIQAAGPLVESGLKAAVLVAAMVTALAVLAAQIRPEQSFPSPGAAFAAGDDWENPQGGLGMRRLVPLRSKANLDGEWEIVVLEAAADASDPEREAALASSFTEAVVSYRATVRLTYRGAGFGRFRTAHRLRAVGVSGFVYTTLDARCELRPAPLPETELLRGEAVEGELCWAVRPWDVESLVMFDRHAFFDPKVGPNFALR